MFKSYKEKDYKEIKEINQIKYVKSTTTPNLNKTNSIVLYSHKLHTTLFDNTLILNYLYIAITF